MKIKKLTIQNINSIYGTWTIDFQHEDYLNNPLFAIVGKTGSGKSTILDAICFALYDQTDRMEKTRGAIASYHTKECMAELEFELNGKTYISHTSMSCGTKDGSFDNAPNGSWLQCDSEKIEGTLRKCARVNELLGLNFSQFRRVILLAQGKFNAFLTEAPDKRADILENITGTEIYSRIGEKIHSMRTNKDSATKELETALALIQVLPTEKKEEKNKRLEEIKSDEAKANEAIKNLEALLSAAQKAKEAEEAIDKLKQEENDLKKREKAFEVEKPRLNAGKIASNVTPAYSAFENIRKEQERDEKEKQSVLDTLPDLQNHRDTAKSKSEAEEKIFQTVAAKKQTREAFLNDIDKLDNEIARLNGELKSNKDAQKKAQENKDKCDKAIATLDKEIAELQNTKKSADEYVQSHQKDSELAVKKVAWDDAYKALCKTRESVDSLKKKEKNEQKKLTQAEKKAQEVKGTLSDKTTALEKTEKAKKVAENALTAALGGHSLEALEIAKNKQTEIVSLLTALKPYEILKTFEEGSPCPVCGATHHPYRQQHFDESPELKAAKDTLKDEQTKYDVAKKASDALTNAAFELANADSAWKLAQSEAATADKELSEKKEAFANLLKEMQENEAIADTQCLQLKGDMAEFGIDWNGCGALPEIIVERNLEYAKQKALSDGFEKQQDSLKAKLAGLNGELSGKVDALNNATTQLAKTDAQLAEISKKRLDTYQDKKTDEERNVLQAQYKEALQQRDAAASALASATTNVANSEKRIETLAEQINSRKDEFTRKEKELNSLLLANGLTIEKYLATRLEQSEMTQLVTEETALAGTRTNLDKAFREQRQKQEDNAKRLPENFNLQETAAQKAELQTKLSELAAERGGIQQELNANEKNSATADKLQNDLKLAKAESDRWAKLDSWLGGQKFKRLAQSYTFEELLGKANEQLHNMLNGRYQMCSNCNDGNLEIDVVDNQLGGDTRTSKNLSGGEQFIISMALALGLASMVGEKLRIDSLFLDEGFGTLDGNELEEAMNTLSQLKGNGKLVGIITHAERLQERIATRLCLEKQGNGRSVIEGPGVHFVSGPKMFVSPEEKKRLQELEKQKKQEKKMLKKQQKAAQ